MPRAQAIRWTVEVASKVFNCANVRTCGIVSVITTLEFLQHHFSESGHKDLLMTRKFILRAWQSPIRSPHAKRLPPGGYVQTSLSVRSTPSLTFPIDDRSSIYIDFRHENASPLSSNPPPSRTLPRPPLRLALRL